MGRVTVTVAVHSSVSPLPLDTVSVTVLSPRSEQLKEEGLTELEVTPIEPSFTVLAFMLAEPSPCSATVTSLHIASGGQPDLISNDEPHPDALEDTLKNAL